MTTIVEMLRAEADAIEREASTYKSFIRADVTDIMISVKFADDTYHHIIPGQKAFRVLTEELGKQLEPEYFNRCKYKHESERMPDFVDQGDMEL